MKTNLLALSALLLFAFSANAADIEALKVDSDSRIESAVRTANDVVSVKTVNAGKYAYKLVAMDSGLNGDIQLTAMILVGEGGVGTAAAYDAAFLLNSSTSADIKASGDGVTVKLRDGVMGTTSKAKYRYDGQSKKLIEIK